MNTYRIVYEDTDGLIMFQIFHSSTMRGALFDFEVKQGDVKIISCTLIKEGK